MNHVNIYFTIIVTIIIKVIGIIIVKMSKKYEHKIKLFH